MDQSSLRLYFADKSIERTVGFAAFSPRKTQPGDWIIPADTVMQFHINVKIHNDLSLISINPHMHRIGSYIKVYAILPDKDTLPLVEVPKWDFEWQEFYRFKTLVKIPAGSVIRAEARYDNTANNYDNPFSPPRDVFFEQGMNDKDEMMRLVIQYVPYREGDEGIGQE
jgi:Copper type II ascorbate-dependent monooxygenase, C-terminal domain